jgi:FkbM family methyltransferase
MKNKILENVLDILELDDKYHRPDNNIYKALTVLVDEYREIYQNDIRVDIFGKSLFIPAIKMGKISTADLFIIHEIILFQKYKNCSSKYLNFIDIGANIGIHSLVARDLGYSVRAYEPDPETFKILKDVVNENGGGIDIINAAISSFDGKSTFIRCDDNLTASGLTSSTKKFYGKTTEIEVDVSNIEGIDLSNSIIKIDAEGSELNILNAIDLRKIRNAKFFIEISNEESREGLWTFFSKNKLNLISQKVGWKEPLSIDELPKSWREGSIGVTIE